MSTVRHIPKVMDCTSCPHRSLRLFCNLTPAAWEMFRAIGFNSHVPSRTTLFREGDACNAAFVICSGRGKLHSTSRSGKSLILRVVQPGEILGLSAMIAGNRHEATAETIEATHLKSIPKAEFTAFLKLHGEASWHASQVLSLENNMAVLNLRRQALASSSAGKLAGVLLEWGRGVCCPGSDMRFAMPLTHEELGSLAGTSRETVTRTLRHLQEQELIQIAGYSMRILSPAGLEKFCGASIDA